MLLDMNDIYIQKKSVEVRMAHMRLREAAQPCHLTSAKDLDLYFAHGTARGFRKPNNLSFPEHKAMDYLQFPESLKLPFHIFFFIYIYMCIFFFFSSFFSSGFRFTGWKLQENLWKRMNSAADILHQKKALFSERSLCYQPLWSTSMSVCLYK